MKVANFSIIHGLYNLPSYLGPHTIEAWLTVREEASTKGPSGLAASAPGRIDLQATPSRFSAFDPDRVQVRMVEREEEDASWRVRLGKTATFEVDASAAGEGTLEMVSG